MPEERSGRGTISGRIRSRRFAVHATVCVLTLRVHTMSLRALKRTKHGTVVDADKCASGARSTPRQDAQGAQQVIQGNPLRPPLPTSCAPSHLPCRSTVSHSRSNCSLVCRLTYASSALGPSCILVIPTDCLQDIAFMVTDVREEENGAFHLWGVTSRGESVLARVPDFEPYFYVSAPDQTAEVPPDDASALISALNRCRPHPGGMIISC